MNNKRADLDIQSVRSLTTPVLAIERNVSIHTHARASSGTARTVKRVFAETEQHEKQSNKERKIERSGSGSSVYAASKHTSTTTLKSQTVPYDQSEFVRCSKRLPILISCVMHSVHCTSLAQQENTQNADRKEAISEHSYIPKWTGKQI